MGASSPRGRSGAISDINMTPLVDVMLVLLIIVMAVGDLIKSKPKAPPTAIDIDLPAAASGDALAEGEHFAVGISATGTLMLNGERVDRAQLSQRTREWIAAKGNDAEVVVAADRRCMHDQFIDVLDVLREAGASRFALQTDRPTTAEAVPEVGASTFVAER